jgi:hypothetical protein
MTNRLIAETASTAPEIPAGPEEPPTASTSAQSEAPGTKAGVVLAGLVLWAALTTTALAGTAPVEPYLRRRDDIWTESSTAEIERDPDLLNQMKTIFDQGASEFFQDGVDSHFSRSLLAILSRYGNAAFRAIADLVFSGAANPDVVSEALRWLGDFKDPATLPTRWAILLRTLRDSSPRVRDGAIIGFAALDDPRARSILLEAERAETIPELRRLIQQVLEQLNATDAAATP